MKSRWTGAIFFWVVLGGVGMAQQTIYESRYDWTNTINNHRWGVADSILLTGKYHTIVKHRYFVIHGFGKSKAVSRLTTFKGAVAIILVFAGLFGCRAFGRIRRSRLID